MREPNSSDPALVGGDVPALQAALAAEHAAIYGYGVAGARLQADQQQFARNLWDAHRTRRDQLTAFIIAQRAEPVPAEAAYRLPVRPTSAATAAQLVIALEERIVNAYLGLAGAGDPKIRRFAAQMMQEAMKRVVLWGATGPSSAFPGMSAAAASPRP